ncbi:hypothetical protein C5E44_29405 [Nocardia nova]|uniref:DUF4145 domain-containing protein n=1 Tax=Nocardia nova TaxID=37330 RepID=UPI000CEA0E1E|nr:hypothetical protein C5E44_29405 [Nocardia nova]
MANRVCWSCEAIAQVERTSEPWQVSVKTIIGPRTNLWASYRCVSCGSGSVAVAEGIAYAGGAEMDRLVSEDSVRWFPRTAIGVEFPDVPQHIAAPATEATGCLSMQHYRAAAIMARAVVEAVAKNKQVTGKNLRDKIDALHNQGLIRGHTKEVAHEIRFTGNDMAHGDFEVPIEPGEAEDVVNFMCEILDEVYQGPARLDRRKTARQAKNAAQNGQAHAQPSSSMP